MSERLTELRQRMAGLADLSNAAGVLEWDHQTMMPVRGAEARAEAMATLERISHDMFVSEETGRMLEAAEGELNGAGADSDDARLIAVTRRRWEKARRVPTELAAEKTRAAALGHEAWVQARANNDFSVFAPYLERNMELARQYVACFDGFECAYDVLLDDYDPGTRTSHVKALFDELREALVPMIATLSEHALDASAVHGTFPEDQQRALVARVLPLMGFNREGWRLDDAVHPFATSFGSSDVRITTRWDESYFPAALFGAMHECGHGLYEEGIAPELQRTPLGNTESLSLHESQSRLWENMVGRGRAFADVLAPLVSDTFGSSIDPDTLFRAVNRVHPSFIRVEADEATYGLHVILRFELEQALIDGRLAVADLPAAWNERFRELFGLEVPNDAEGVLQDVHWSAGLIGYFPTYALGNLIGGQLWRQAHDDMPDLEATIARGELSPLREWLRENVHRHGAKYSSAELLERVVGGPIAVAPFVDYLREKLTAVYGVAL